MRRRVGALFLRGSDRFSVFRFCAGFRDPAPVKPDKKEKCPVCGMFVYKYPDWVGEIIFNDGSTAFFDGAKDLFKYYFDLKKYNPGKTRKGYRGHLCHGILRSETRGCPKGLLRYGE